MPLSPQRLALGLAIVVGCAGDQWPPPPPIEQEQFVREFNDWRAYRRSRLVLPATGPVTWIGLWELGQGATPLGSDSSLPIVLAAQHAPRQAGTLRRIGNDVRFEPAAGARIRLGDSARTVVNAALPLVSDRSANPTVLALGSLRLRVHGEPGTERLWVRAWDENHPAREAFTMPASYPPDTAWRLSARFEAFDTPRDFPVMDILSGTQAYRSPGTLAFRVGGATHRLVAFADSTSKQFFVMLWDSTAKTTTYQAGRYLQVPFADSTGWTVIDFNRTYNPPCVFTPFSTCAFPPRENRLGFALLAGEKRVR